MKRYVMIAACLAATLTTGAVMSASASAGSLPALYECAKVTPKGSGKYNKGCKVEGKHGTGENDYEIKEGFGKGKTFKAKGIGGADLEAEGVGGIDCEKSSATGRFTSPTTGDSTATFGDCEFSGHKCNSPGAASGTIVTDPLVAVDGYLSGKGTLSPKVGAAFSPESGEFLATFTCGPFDFAVTGVAIGEISPVNKFSKEAVFTFRQRAVGVQEWENFEEGPNQHLEVHECENCANPKTEGLGVRGDEEVEIKAKGEELELKA
ncbi:MAG TPA: hypothetical protein VMA83_00145 [Solirubrobacteraceae bacterium]|nr:hypothetical protein [Solirubrobacteraceae bacterium]